MTSIVAPPPSARRITDGLYISAQPQLADFETLSAAGFTAVISNRPEGEDPAQPSAPAERQAAEAAGLAFHFIPVTAATITEADVRAFQQALAAADGPVFAHCRSGIRSATLFAIGEVLDGRMAAEDLAGQASRWGVDLTLARQWLARAGTSETPPVGRPGIHLTTRNARRR